MPTPTSATERGAEAAAATRVVLLGTGTPVPDPRREGPSLAVVSGGHAYLVDAGVGVVRQAAAAAERGMDALRPAQLSYVFLTHLHSDHTLGLADLIVTPGVVGRPGPLRVFGPPGVEEMVSHLQAAYAVDRDVRTRAEGAAPGRDCEPRVLPAGERHTLASLEVRAFAVPHGDFPDARGYRFDAPDRSIVVSGDTGPGDAVADACDGCDVLVHEVYCERGLSERPARVQRYHRRFHTSAPELARLAKRARPGLLVLTHLLPFGCSEAELLAEVRAEYGGEVVLGEDLGVY